VRRLGRPYAAACGTGRAYARFATGRPRPQARSERHGEAIVIGSWVAQVAGAWALALVVAPALAAPAAHPDDAATIVREVAEAYAAAERGAVAFEVTTRTKIKGGFYTRDDVESAAYAVVDGKATLKRVLRLAQGHRVADAGELQRESAKADGPLSRFGLRLPYHAAAAGAYAFDPPRTDTAGIEIPFRSNVRDESHGDGTLTIDAERRLSRVVFHPAKLPDRATDATLTIEFGPVATGRWDITRIVREFGGRIGFLRGRVESTSTYDAYRSFATAELAHAAIERE
jgi:hypothetical protein